MQAGQSKLSKDCVRRQIKCKYSIVNSLFMSMSMFSNELEQGWKRRNDDYQELVLQYETL